MIARLAATLLASAALAACDNERQAEADTGSATAEVSTTASEAQVTDAQLQEQAQQAATAVSEPVDGSGPVVGTTPPAAEAK